MTGNLILDTFKTSLPVKPYCTDDLGFGLMIRPAEQAITKRYIQPNSPTSLRWLVYDVDRPTAHFDWDDIHAPAPNMTVMNPENGHAHLLYGLEVPVLKNPHNCRTNKFSEKAYRYVSAIDCGLIQKLQSDENYAELICKNPLNPDWDTNVWRNESYQLSEIADYLDLSAYTDSRKRLPEIGLGRNCNLFDETRFFAYREIRKPVERYLFDEMYSEADFIDRCICYAKCRNTFAQPLPLKECQTIGKSIGKWVYRNMSPAGFREWAERRRQKSIEVRQVQAKSLRSKVRRYKANHPELSNREIARIYGISKDSVRIYLV